VDRKIANFAVITIDRSVLALHAEQRAAHEGNLRVDQENTTSCHSRGHAGIYATKLAVLLAQW
jgi:hypothetical protein